ncbi:MAG: chemotaxis protein CheD, partial [Planctomycetes bacterium]|nr:chemotaxis protein CheD [Planctomycetota bacterium]
MTANPDRIFLLPGEYHVSRLPCHMATLLGSCVAVCLRHENRPYAAMNHFLLAHTPGSGDHDKGRYGDTSVETIVWLMRKLDPGGKITAKMYGGAAVVSHLGSSTDIGLKNVEVAREILKKHGIPLGAEDGG